MDEDFKIGEMVYMDALQFDFNTMKSISCAIKVGVIDVFHDYVSIIHSNGEKEAVRRNLLRRLPMGPVVERTKMKKTDIVLIILIWLFTFLLICLAGFASMVDRGHFR